MSSMFGKSTNTALPGNKPLTLSPYGTEQGQALANDITSGAKTALPGAAAAGAQAGALINKNIDTPDAGNIANFGREMLTYNPYQDRSFQDVMSSVRGGDNASLANDRARMASGLAKIGVNPSSTAYQMANQSAAAATHANTNRTLAALIGDQAKLGAQMRLAAPGLITQGLTLPGAVANAGSSAMFNPYLQAGQALQADRTPVYFNQQLDNVQDYKPGIMDRIGQGVQLASKVYGMVNPAYGMATGGGGDASTMFNSSAKR